MDAQIIETHNLSKKIGKKDIIKNLCLTIPRGKITGLLGPNGAGKSTLLKLLTGMYFPTSGNILFNGHKWKEKDLSSIGSLIDTPALYENLTAEENMLVRAIPLHIHESKIKELLQTVNLTDTSKKRVKHFSLGMKQRLGIAIALINNPEFLILDEPTNGLDPIGMQEFRNLILSLSQKGVTVLISSHLLRELEDIANYIVILIDGNLKYQGDFSLESNLEELFINVVNN